MINMGFDGELTANVKIEKSPPTRGDKLEVENDRK
jgi:hypothetical protein